MEIPKLLFSNDHFLVINKPAGWATEPPGRQSIRDWLVKQSKIIPTEWQDERVGIVHRLDTDTSGVLLWAKNQSTQEQLRLLWRGRAVEKTYLALVSGDINPEGIIELSLVRDNKKDRQAVSWVPTDKSRSAMTRYKKIGQGLLDGEKVSLVEAHPVTGRTHQIRVHLKAVGHPIIGDSLYGEKVSTGIAKKLGLKRQFLHAQKITLEFSGKKYQFEAPLPNDLAEALKSVSIPNLHQDNC